MPAQTLQVSKQTLLRATGGGSADAVLTSDDHGYRPERIDMQKCCRGRSHSRGICHPADNVSFEAYFPHTSGSLRPLPPLGREGRITSFCFRQKPIASSKRSSKLFF